MHESWRDEYRGISDLLMRHLEFDSALDLGCGNGFIIERLREHEKRCLGVDGSPNAKADLVHDLTQPLALSDRSHLVICTEVAEHLPENAADVLVTSIVNHTERFIFFTAARDWFGGHHHVNCQELPYWIGKFEARGFTNEIDFARKLRAEMRKFVVELWWFPANLLIFRRIP